MRTKRGRDRRTIEYDQNRAESLRLQSTMPYFHIIFIDNFSSTTNNYFLKAKQNSSISATKRLFCQEVISPTLQRLDKYMFSYHKDGGCQKIPSQPITIFLFVTFKLLMFFFLLIFREIEFYLNNFLHKKCRQTNYLFFPLLSYTHLIKTPAEYTKYLRIFHKNIYGFK